MIQGSLVALVTPMTDKGGLDIERVPALLDWHLEAGTAGIVVAGTTGEGSTLSSAEYRALIERVLAHVDGRLPVIAGTGTNATDKTIAQTQLAHELGVDACLVVTPYYNKPTQEGLYQHYMRICDAVPVPIILYNVPARTACDLLPETIARLMHVPTIVGVKEAAGDLTRYQTLCELCAGHMAVYSGDDVTAMDLMLLGGDGVISVTANVAPRQMADLWEAARRKQTAEARALQEQLLPLHRALFVESNPIPVKWALMHLGRIASGVRLPLTPLASAHHAQLVQELQSLSLMTQQQEVNG